MKNNYMTGNINKAFYLILFAFILVGCNRDRNNPGWDYFPDMFYSAAYETFTPNPNFKNGSTMRVPVEGTVPRGFIPFPYTTDPESRILAGKELINPYSPSDETLKRGREAYTTFCLDCHGISGKGDGHLFKSGLYPMPPRDLTAAEAVALKDGEIYHTITLGFGSMGAHGSQIQPDVRWKIVLYIRELQEQAKSTSDIKQEENK